MFNYSLLPPIKRKVFTVILCSSFLKTTVKGLKRINKYCVIKVISVSVRARVCPRALVCVNYIVTSNDIYFQY